jgi:hypothetical protein
MATPAQLTANQTNAHASTGPRTESGKQHSSQNAITSGLFTLRDFIRPEEQPEYEQLASQLASELNPSGVLEETFAAAILGAAWRLRRCSLVEARMVETCGIEPMEDEVASRIQLSVDRARAQAHNIMRRSLAELRRLQTDRAIRREIYESAPEPPVQDLTSDKDVVIALNHADRGKLLAKKVGGLDTIASLLDQQLGSFCKQPLPTPIDTPRNGQR